HALLPIAGKGDSNWKYAWIPVVGPILGGSLGAVFYKIIFEGTTRAVYWGVVAIVVVVLALAYGMSKKQDYVAGEIKRELN
ncbi:hypothetical protein L1I79_39450, partial [Strepomyces sp. STD 3.1]|nr:hypothetical protein [Streptomyces sp. STD 3.1]